MGLALGGILYIKKTKGEKIKEYTGDIGGFINDWRKNFFKNHGLEKTLDS